MTEVIEAQREPDDGCPMNAPAGSAIQADGGDFRGGDSPRRFFPAGIEPVRSRSNRVRREGRIRMSGIRPNTSAISPGRESFRKGGEAEMNMTGRAFLPAAGRDSPHGEDRRPSVRIAAGYPDGCPSVPARRRTEDSPVPARERVCPEGTVITRFQARCLQMTAPDLLADIAGISRPDPSPTGTGGAGNTPRSGNSTCMSCLASAADEGGTDPEQNPCCPPAVFR